MRAESRTIAPVSVGVSRQDDDPVTLKEACEIVFRGKITPWTLRAEANRGKLRIFRVGKKDFTTLKDVRELCDRSGRGSVGEQARKHGSSVTALNTSERVAALASDLRRRRS